jgi:hypothetical protein
MFLVAADTWRVCQQQHAAYVEGTTTEATCLLLVSAASTAKLAYSLPCHAGKQNSALCTMCIVRVTQAGFSN